MQDLSREMSLEFDLLWNNIASDKAPGLELYEKSVFLTQGQEALVKDYFSNRTNPVQEGFDDSERRQSDFLTLIESAALSPLDNADTSVKFRTVSGTKYYQYPANAFLVLNEELNVTATGFNQYYTVVPVSYDEYARLMMKPYKFPPKGQVWRLLTNTGNVQSGGRVPQVIELIGRFPSGASLNYRMRYVKRPEPIILDNLSGGLTIEGKSAETVCTLPKHLHNEIIQRAVLLAKIAWIDTPSPQAAAR